MSAEDILDAALDQIEGRGVTPPGSAAFASLVGRFARHHDGDQVDSAGDDLVRKGVVVDAWEAHSWSEDDQVNVWRSKLAVLDWPHGQLRRHTLWADECDITTAMPATVRQAIINACRQVVALKAKGPEAAQLVADAHRLMAVVDR